MGKKMPDRVFKGRTISDRDYIEENGDAVTDFVASRDDLVSLARGLVRDCLNEEFQNSIQTSTRDVVMMWYTFNRLDRLLNYMPELEEKVGVDELLKQGRKKNKADLERYLKRERKGQL